MNPDLQNAVVLITSCEHDRRGFGTGFVIHHDSGTRRSYVVTCTHVLSKIECGDLLRIDGDDKKYSVLMRDDGSDLSLIELEDMATRPVIRLAIHTRSRSPVLVVGFAGFGQHYSKRRLEGILMDQVTMVSRGTAPRKFSAWELSIVSDASLQDGFSGSPVIETDSANCVAVMSYRQGEGARGLAVSVAALEDTLSRLPNAAAGFIAKPGQYDRSGDYLDLLFSRATASEIKGDLGTALEIFERIKEQDPLYGGIDRAIARVRNELRRAYVDRYGRVDRTQVVTTWEHRQYPHSASPSMKPRRILVCYSMFVVAVIAAILIGVSLYYWFNN